MSEEINLDRHRFLGTAAVTVAAARLDMIGSAKAQSNETKPANLPSTKPETNTSFGALKQIDAGLLNVGYAEAGPANGTSSISRPSAAAQATKNTGVILTSSSSMTARAVKVYRVFQHHATPSPRQS
jgi:hypothetical protein